MRLAHHPGSVAALPEPSIERPWRVLVSACLVGEASDAALGREPYGVDGTDYGMGGTLSELLGNARIVVVPFCPERFGLGVPRTMPDIHGGDGASVLDGDAQILDERGRDLTAQMIRGAEAMCSVAREAAVTFAILTDMSAACGSQVISRGCRFDSPRRYQQGVGVATAMLLRQGISVVSQRDHATLGRLRARVEHGFVPDPAAVDHHDHPWVLANLRGN